GRMIRAVSLVVGALGSLFVVGVCRSAFATADHEVVRLEPVRAAVHASLNPSPAAAVVVEAAAPQAQPPVAQPAKAPRVALGATLPAVSEPVWTPPRAAVA